MVPNDLLESLFGAKEAPNSNEPLTKRELYLLGVLPIILNRLLGFYESLLIRANIGGSKEIAAIRATNEQANQRMMERTLSRCKVTVVTREILALVGKQQIHQ